MSELVQFLCKGDHPVEASLREKTRAALKASIAGGHVRIKFTDTRGGTELGVPIDRSRSDLRAPESTWSLIFAVERTPQRTGSVAIGVTLTLPERTVCGSL